MNRRQFLVGVCATALATGAPPGLPTKALVVSEDEIYEDIQALWAALVVQGATVPRYLFMSALAARALGVE